MLFSPKEAIAQERLRAKTPFFEFASHFCSSGRALLAVPSDLLKGEDLKTLVRHYKRVLFVGQQEHLSATLSFLMPHKIIIDRNMIWLAALTSEIKQKCETVEVSGDLDFRFVSNCTAQSTMLGIQALIRRNGLIPTPCYFLQSPLFETIYVLGGGDVIGVTSCVSLDLNGTCLDRTVMLLHTCVHENHRRLGLARLMRKHLISKAIDKFDPVGFGSVVRPTNHASISVNLEYGFMPSRTISVAMTEEIIDDDL